MTDSDNRPDAPAPGTAPEFEPQNELERLLVATTSGGAAERAAFEQALMAHPLWAALTPEPGDAEDMIRLRSVTQADGRVATALFTSRERVVATCGDEVEPRSWPARALLETVRRNPAILNPGHALGVRWTPEAITRLLNLGRIRPMPTDMQVPTDLPEGLVAGLERELAAEPTIRAVWLAAARWEGGENGYVLDLRADPSEVAIPALISRALEGVPLDRRLDVVVGSPAEPDGTGLVVVGRR